METTDPHRFMDASGAENACGQAMKRKRDRENENAPQLLRNIRGVLTATGSVA